MPMPEGIVSVLIDRESGCPARAGQRDVIFEVFEDGNVPDCEVIDELPDIFNDASGIDPVTGEPDDEAEPLF